jgi:hypothetical protein
LAELVQFPLRAGIEQGVDPKQLPPGTLLTAENYFQDKTNRVRKKYGTRGLTKNIVGGGLLGTAARLITRGKDTGLFDKTDLYVYGETALNAHQRIDRAAALEVTKRLHLDASRGASVADIAIATSPNLLVTFFMVGDPVGSLTTGQPLYVTVENMTTGGRLLPPTLVTAAGMFPRVLIDSTTSRVVLLWSTNGNIACSELSLSTFALTGVGNLRTTVSASAIFDAVLRGNVLYVAHEDTGVGIRVTRFDASYAVSATALFGSTGLRAVSIAVEGTGIFTPGIYVAYSETGSGQTSIRTLDAFTLATTAGPTVIVGSVSSFVFAENTGIELLVGWGNGPSVQGAASGGHSFFTQTYTSPGLAAVAFTRRTTYHAFPQSKPFLLNGKWYALATVYPLKGKNGSIQGVSSVLLEIRTSEYNSASVPPHLHIATLANQTGWYQQAFAGSSAGVPTQRGYLTKAAQSNFGQLYILAPHRDREPTSGVELLPTGFDLHTIEPTPSDLFRSSIVNANAFVAAAAPFYSDGANAFPAGFLHPPTIRAATAVNTGASLGVGTYFYSAVFVWRDANGVLHRSEPSTPQSASIVGGAGTNGIELVISTSSASPKQNEQTGFGATSASPVMIELYRTTADGSIFYKLTHEPMSGVVVNDPTAVSITYVDGVADSDVAPKGYLSAGSFPLASQPQLYNVLEVEDLPPSGFVTETIHRGRIFGIEGDRRTLAASKLIGEDLSIAPAFHETLTITFDEDKYALGSIGERLAVFGASTIDVVEGDGPDSFGQQRDWRVMRLQTDVGCIVPKSIVATPLGIIFKSARSFAMLGLDLTVRDIGSSVEDFLVSYPTITSAVLVASESHVRFTCNNSFGTNGIVLVYDYARGAWYSWKYYDSDYDVDSAAFVDAMLINGVYTLLTANGKIYREETNHAFDDITNYVTGEVVLAHFSRSGPVGWSRVKAVQVLGTSRSRHQLEVSIARDYATAYEQTETWAADTDVTTPGPLEKARVTLKHQKLEAVQVRIRDLEPAGGALGLGEGLQLEAIGLWVKPKEGPAKASASRRK